MRRYFYVSIISLALLVAVSGLYAQTPHHIDLPTADLNDDIVVTQLRLPEAVVTAEIVSRSANLTAITGGLIDDARSSPDARSRDVEAERRIAGQTARQY